jgi:cyclin-dependent kinase-like
MALIRPIANENEVEKCAELEALGYPPDEAASLSSLKFRFKAAPDLFLGTFQSDELIGFIVATLTDSKRLTHASMSNHVDGGVTAAVHSVCVAENWRRKGIALQLLNAFKNQCVELNSGEGCKRVGTAGGAARNIERIALIAKKDLVPLYEKAGFTLLGLSEVVHGQDPWYELQLELEEHS